MKRSFDPAVFEAAIRKKDYIKLKNFVINSIRNNPRFTHDKNEKYSEATKVFRRLHSLEKELPGLFAPYELQTGEVEFNEAEKDSWTQEYFIRQTFYLGENFCNKRFANIKKIGQYLTKGNFNDPQEVIEGYEDSIHFISDSTDTKKSVGKKPWLIVVFVIVSIITLLVGKKADIKWLFIIGVVLVVVTLVIALIKFVRRS